MNGFDSDKLKVITLQDLPVFLIIIRNDFTILWGNTEAALQLKVAAADLAGKNALSLLGETDPNSPVLEIVNKVVTACTAQEAVISSSNDRTYYYQAFPLIPESDTEKAGIAVMRKDITNLHQDFQLIQTSEKQYRCIAESAREGIWQVNAMGETVFANQKMASILGYTMREMKQLSFWDSLENPHSDVNPLMTGQNFNDTSVDFVMYRKDGCIVNVIINQSIMFDDNSNPSGMLYMITDITRRKSLEKKLIDRDNLLKEQNIQVQQKNMALKELILQLKNEQTRLETNVVEHVEQLVLPLVERMMINPQCDQTKTLKLLADSIRNITSGFVSTVTYDKQRLTPRQLEICNMVKNGLTSKEIAEILGITPKCVDNHRNNIRKKLKINGSDISLAGHLNQIN